MGISVERLGWVSPPGERILAFAVSTKRFLREKFSVNKYKGNMTDVLQKSDVVDAPQTVTPKELAELASNSIQDILIQDVTKVKVAAQALRGLLQQGNLDPRSGQYLEVIINQSSRLGSDAVAIVDGITMGLEKGEVWQDHRYADSHLETEHKLFDIAKLAETQSKQTRLG